MAHIEPYLITISLWPLNKEWQGQHSQFLRCLYNYKWSSGWIRSGERVKWPAGKKQTVCWWVSLTSDHRILILIFAYFVFILICVLQYFAFILMIPVQSFIMSIFLHRWKCQFKIYPKTRKSQLICFRDKMRRKKTWFMCSYSNSKDHVF